MLTSPPIDTPPRKIGRLQCFLLYSSRISCVSTKKHSFDSDFSHDVQHTPRQSDRAAVRFFVFSMKAPAMVYPGVFLLANLTTSQPS